MPTKNYDSSFLTQQRQVKEIYANYITTNQKINQGCTTRGFFQQGAAGTFSSDQITAVDEGAVLIGSTTRDDVLSNPQNNCPVNTVVTSAPAPAPPPTLNLLVLGDSGASNIATGITTRLTALGYTGFTVNSVTIGTSYTGSTDLANTNTYNTVLLYTNSSQTGAPALSTNLKNWVALGGNLVTGTFIWNLYPSGFDFTITPLQSNPQSNDPTGNLTVTVVHPITTGITTTITNGNTILNNGNASLQSGATTIATFTSSGVPYVVIKTSGASRLVAINAYINAFNIYLNFRNLVTNACLWAVGILN